MPVKKDEDGNRYVEAEVEVPGSPEEVWEAIATADGISSWFMQTTGPETWRVIREALEIDGASSQFASASAAPELGGVVERMEITDPELLRVRESSPQVVAALDGMEGEEPELLLRLDRPAQGLAHLFLMPMGEQTMVSARFFFYGDQAAAVAAGAEQEWTDWLAERFPPDATA
jgi:uncharacterized protein YndB with AHSA1/START domain